MPFILCRPPSTAAMPSSLEYASLAASQLWELHSTCHAAHTHPSVVDTTWPTRWVHAAGCRLASTCRHACCSSHVSQTQRAGATHNIDTGLKRVQHRHGLPKQHILLVSFGAHFLLHVAHRAAITCTVKGPSFQVACSVHRSVLQAMNLRGPTWPPVARWEMRAAQFMTRPRYMMRAVAGLM
jgi:hypothetical protein